MTANQTCLQGKTEIGFSFSIFPLGNAQYDLSGKLGNFHRDYIREFFPEILGKRADVIISELLSNVLENTADKKSKCTVSVKLSSKMMLIKVKNVVEPWQFDNLRAHLKMIKRTHNVNKLMSDAITYRRSQGLKGGLGLIRLASECKARLSVSFNPSTSLMTVTAKNDLRGLV